MRMYRCDECGKEYEEPIEETICVESEYGVASLFSNMNYKTVLSCPYCGCDHYWSHDIEEEEDGRED